MSTNQHERGERFRSLHRGAPFLLPNPWDAGSARVLADLGFPALATTSSGLAFTLGRPDGSVGLDEVLAHTRVLVQATHLPVSVDLEHGYGADVASVAAAIRGAAAAGAVGGSIEDFDASHGVYDIGLAAERIAHAAATARELDDPFVLTARAENHIRGNPDLDDTIARLRAYEAAGADVLYAPGLRTIAEVRAVRAATTRPLNVLARPDLDLAALFAAGAQRVSVGGALAWVAVGALVRAAERIRDRGDLSVLAEGDAARIARIVAR